MKILHVYKDFDPPVHGGIEGHVAISCRYQQRWGDVEALTCSRTWRTRVVVRDGIQVTEVGEWGRFQNAPLSPLFPRYLGRARADVNVLHLPNPTAEVAWLLARPRGALVVRYHSDVVRQARAMKIYAPVQQALLRKADLVLPTSQQYLDSSKTLSAHHSRCRIVPLGIEAECFQSPDGERVAALRNEYGAEFVLFVGRHRYYKGLNTLVEAAKSISAPIVIAGDGPERSRLVEAAERQGVRIHFPGSLSQEDLIAHLHACSVFVFPSVARSEAFGIAILEAHASARPVVATRLGTGVEFVNEDGKTGYNVPPDDPTALAEAVNKLVENPETRDAMGAYAQARVNREFSAKAIAEEEWRLYGGLL